MKKRVFHVLAIAGAGIAAAGIYAASMNVSQHNAKSPAAAVQEENNASKMTGEQLEVNEHSSEVQVIQAMHKMTHQKVKADKKWGAIVMKKEMISKIYDILHKSEFRDKKNLLAIAERWKAGNFQRIVEDHNYFWKLQGGTVGKAYGKMDEQEEEMFCLKHFGDEVTAELQKAGEL